MNTCEKKELKSVLQKLSDKLEGKIVGGAIPTTIESDNTPTNFLSSPGYKGLILPDGILGLPFSFKYKNVSYSYFFNLVLPGNDYKTLYKDTIKSITFSTTSVSIKSSKMTKTYNFSGTKSYDQGLGQLLAYSILINNKQFEIVDIFQNNNPFLAFPTGINVIINIPKYTIQK